MKFKIITRMFFIGIMLIVSQICYSQTFYWNDLIGLFDDYGDYTSFAYDQLESIPKASTSWDTTTFNYPPYVFDNNCLKISFSNQTEGIKITSYAKFTTTSNSTTEQWKRLRIRYYCQSSCNMVHFTPSLLLYDSNTSYVIKQIGASFTGESNIITGNWHIYDTYVRCKKNIGQLQLSFKNNGRSGNVYIDYIQLTSATPPSLVEGKTIEATFYQGDFNVYSDLTGWAFQPGDSNNAPTYFWDTANQRLGVTFSNPSQEMKITCMNTFAIDSGSDAVLSFDVLVNKSNGQPNTVDCSGYLYADGFNWPFDIGANVLCSDLPTNQNYTLFSVLESDTNVTRYRLPQVIVKNNNDAPITVYIDNVHLKHHAMVYAVNY